MSRLDPFPNVPHGEPVGSLGERRQMESLSSVTLRGMAKGQAGVWSPEAGVLQKVDFPMFQTFDSFSEHAQTAPKKWATVDVEQVREKLARVVEEQKANDPRELRAMNVRLTDEVRQLRAQSDTLSGELEFARIRIRALEQVEAVQESVFTQDDMTHIESVSSKTSLLHEAINNLEAVIREATKRVSARLPSMPPVVSHPRTNTETTLARVFPKPLSAYAPSNGNGEMPKTGGKTRILTAIVQRPGISAKQAGIRAGMSWKSGSFRTYMGGLRTAGYIEGSGDSLRPTSQGIQALGRYEPLPTGSALLEYWQRELGGGMSRMLGAIAAAYPKPVSPEEIGRLVDMSHTSGSFRTYMGRLRSLELVRGSSAIIASDELFD